MAVIYKTIEVTTLPESGEKYVKYIVGTTKRSCYIWDGTQFVPLGADLTDFLTTQVVSTTSTWTDCTFGEEQSIAKSFTIPSGYKYVGIVEAYMGGGYASRVCISGVHHLYIGGSHKIQFDLICMVDNLTFNASVYARVLLMKE